MKTKGNFLRARGEDPIAVKGWLWLLAYCAGGSVGSLVLWAVSR